MLTHQIHSDILMFAQKPKLAFPGDPWHIRFLSPCLSFFYTKGARAQKTVFFGKKVILFLHSTIKLLSYIKHDENVKH